MIFEESDAQGDDSPTDELPILTEHDVVDLDSSSILTLADGPGVDVPAGSPASTGRFPLPDGLPDVEPFPEPDEQAALLRKRILLLEATVEDKDAEIASLAERLKATRDAVVRRDETERQLRAQLAGGAPEMQQLVARLEEAEWLAAQYAERVAELTSRLRTLEQTASRRDSAFAELEAELIAREALVVERERALGYAEAGSSSGPEATSRAAADGGASLWADHREARPSGMDVDASPPAVDGNTSPPAVGGDASPSAADGDASPPAVDGDASPPAVDGETPRTASPDTKRSPELESALARSREEAAALAAYVDCRRAHWLALEAQLEEHRERLRELEQEIEQRTERERLEGERADSERRRADALKAELGRMRTTSETAEPPLLPSMPAGTYAATPDESFAATLSASSAATPSISAAQIAPISVESGPATASPDEARTLADSPDGASSDLASPDVASPGVASPELASSDLAPPELASPDLASSELVSPEPPPPGVASPDLASPDVPSTGSATADANGAAPDQTQVPTAVPHETPTTTLRAPRPDLAAAPTFEAALLCLTSDPPREHRLTESATLVGRSPHCDIRIATHFVSREHARVIRDHDQITIEDLGSKNGVFVNAVRVERDALRHGDLVTIGDTQFRFEIHTSLSA